MRFNFFSVKKNEPQQPADPLSYAPKFCNTHGTLLEYREEPYYDTYTGKNNPLKFVECSGGDTRYQFMGGHPPFHDGVWLSLNEF